MQKKNTNQWLDVQIVIATIAMTIVLALWNLFAGNNRTVDLQAAVQSQTGAIITSTTDSAQSPSRILLGGPAPQAQSPSYAPAPITITSSSQP